ncbi:MAG: glycoside hydrolase family 2, partial [Tannerella sp.]|nr:glycoside hydrolase family 2 [Tannerella sp.]
MEENRKSNVCTRRKFLKSGMVLAAGVPAMRMYSFAPPLTNRPQVEQQPDDDSLYELFRNPPATAKPFVRWWWNGDKLSAKEIVRELDVMKAAGIGGVEINPIAFPGGDDLGIPSLPWL